MMEFPKGIVNLTYRNGVFVCDDVEETEIRAPLNREVMDEAVSGPSLYSFTVEDYPITDELLADLEEPLRSVRGLFIENNVLTDEGFRLFFGLPYLETLVVSGNSAITGESILPMEWSRLETLWVWDTGFSDNGLSLAAHLPHLENIDIADTRVTFDGLLGVSWRDGLKISDWTHHEDSGMKRLFTAEQWKAFRNARAYKVKKDIHPLNERSAAEASAVLTDFFEQMVRWERFAWETGGASSPAISEPLYEIFKKYVSAPPRFGYLPQSICISDPPAFSGMEIVDMEQVNRDKIYIYTEKNIFYNRYTMRRKDGVWKIDDVQQERLGKWVHIGF